MSGNAATVGAAAACGGGGRSSHGVAAAEKPVASSARAQIKGHIHLCVVFRLIGDNRGRLRPGDRMNAWRTGPVNGSRSLAGTVAARARRVSRST